MFDAIQPFEMSHAVLRHRRLPLVDAREERLGAQSENLLQFIAHDSDDLAVGAGPDNFRVVSRKKAT